MHIFVTIQLYDNNNKLVNYFMRTFLISTNICKGVRDMDVKRRFATRLKQLREEKGLSQAQLGEKIGVSRGSISFYENESRIPDIEVLEKISLFFEVPSDYLLGLIRQ